ncbi:hypothetical protein GF324_13915 [bacterium]|nr:hypothetical protein [bacterium]
MNQSRYAVPGYRRTLLLLSAAVLLLQLCTVHRGFAKETKTAGAAEIDRGSVMVGGFWLFREGDRDDRLLYLDGSQTDPSTRYSNNLLARIGAAPFDRWFIGFEGGYTLDTHIYTFSSDYYGDERLDARKSAVWYALWTRYYLPIREDRLFFVPDVSIGRRHMVLHEALFVNDQPVQNEREDLSGFGYRAGVGLALFFTPHVSLDLRMQYQWDRLKGTYLEGQYSAERRTEAWLFLLGISGHVSLFEGGK